MSNEIELARRLCAHGIPVVICRPRVGWEPGTSKSDLLMPKGWHKISAASALDALDDFRPGVDALAMVGGHGLDVIDVDTKDGGDVNDVPSEIEVIGRHRTPSGGWHLFIRSTGVGKMSPLVDRSTGAKIGDYVGGTAAGAAQMLAYLPGSSRPKYEAGYEVVEPIDFSAIVGDPDPIAVEWLLTNGGTMTGEAAQTADWSAAKDWLLSLPEHLERPCNYGSTALAMILEEADEIDSGGRHGWAIRSGSRIVELAKFGCLDRSAVLAWSEKFTQIKPEGGSSHEGIIAWAVANVKATSACTLHGTTGVELPTASDYERVGVVGLHDEFRRWLGADFDTDVVTAVAASAVAHRHLDGDPAWLLVVAGSGGAKTEVVSTLEAVGAFVESQIQSPGALLSGTSSREVTSDATGGLLNRIGDEGVLVLKDATSILSMQRDARQAVLGALREVYDGRWTRNLGTDGGKTVEWNGRLTLVGGVTTAWDEHHAVVATMGDRFLLIRPKTTDSRQTGVQALRNLGGEGAMRDALKRAMAGAVLHADAANVGPLTDEDIHAIVGAADVVAKSRSQVVKSFQGKTEWAHDAEYPTRLGKQLAQIFRGAQALGCSRDDALRLMYRVAADTIPVDRYRFLAYLLRNPGSGRQETREALGISYHGAENTLETLTALNVVRSFENDGRPEDSVLPSAKPYRAYELAFDADAIESFTAMVDARDGAAVQEKAVA